MEDRAKAIEGFVKNRNPKSLIKIRLPDNTDSSKSIPFLYNVINNIMSAHKRSKMKIAS